MRGLRRCVACCGFARFPLAMAITLGAQGWLADAM